MPIPPLRQSHAVLMACPELYRVTIIEGKRLPESPFSDRGTEIHRIMSAYIDHCTRRGVAADWAEFDRLASAAGPEAGPILDGLRDNYIVDYEHVYGTEITLALDEKFRPIPVDGVWNIVGNFERVEDETPFYSGTLDCIEFSDDLTSAKISDFKSHFRPFDPETFQSKQYPAFIFAHFPKVEEVTFELVFVRFRNARRPVTYKRDQLPILQTEMRRRREQQKQIHERVERGETVQALPGNHCVYCPHNKTNTCPVAEFNPYVNKTMEERLIFIAWAKQSLATNIEVLKAYIDDAGPVAYKDGNGKTYEFSNSATESAYFPAVQTMKLLLEWHEDGADPALFNGLRISGLKSKLKAHKRAPLDQRLHDEVVQTETKVQLAIHTPEGSARVVEEEW